jgi:hypothetical protein
MILIEHRERVVRQRGAAGRHERGAHHESNQLTFHAHPPFRSGILLLPTDPEIPAVTMADFAVAV